MSQIEIACEDLVFHFNKKHLEDPTIPMWVLKTHGESYYVHHVDSTLPWTTKETPDNPHTKGSLKFKRCLLTIDEDNTAKIDKLTIYDKIRLRNQRLGITRIMWYGQSFDQVLKDEEIKHTPFKRVHGACSTAYTVCDLMDKHDAMMLGLKYPGRFRILMPNEPQYRAYDDKKLWDKLQTDYDSDEYADDDE